MWNGRFARFADMQISIVGEAGPTPEIAALAEEVGAELGRRGITLVCGGGQGVMEAACRGAKSQGGTTIGILPGSDLSAANDWVDVTIPTGLGQARNVIIARSGSAAIAIGGRYGTLTEIGHALKAGIPVVGLRTWTLSKSGAVDPSIIVATDAKDAVEKAVSVAERPRPTDISND
ncbi:MAG: TIGR00725 family protein [Chloroflexi bacterium]|nr:TIGR00725 family protein [Chloroflexota bacterium]